MKIREGLSLLGPMQRMKNDVRWFERDDGDARLVQDRKLIANKYSGLKYALNHRLKEVVLKGSMVLIAECGIPTEIETKIILPDDYPQSEPKAFETEHQFEHILDRHFYPNGRCCLWMSLESQWDAKDENALLRFLDQLAVFYERQLIYDATGGTSWPWGERGHGSDGYKEYFRESLNGDDNLVSMFLPMLKGETKLLRKTSCPCNSGKSYLKCHAQSIERIKGNDTAVEILKQLY